MYIGPWQEYRLSKQRGGPPRREVANPLPSSSTNSVSSDVIKELEKALQNSLDPAAAQAAMQAMNKVLKERTQQVVPVALNMVQRDQYSFQRPPRQQRPNVDSLSLHILEHQQQQQQFSQDQQLGNRQIGNIYNEFPVGATDQSRKYRLTIPTMALSARDRISMDFNSQPSPASVRSSKSEPIQSLPSLIQVTPAVARSHYSSLTSKNLAINEERFQQQQQQQQRFQSDQQHNLESEIPSKSISSKKVESHSGYDTDAVVQFLRRDRNHRAKSEISKLTGWNILQGGGIAHDVRSSLVSDMSNYSKMPVTEPTKDRATVLREKKIAEVQQRKALYLQNVGEQSVVAEPLQSDQSEKSMIPMHPEPPPYSAPIGISPLTNRLHDIEQFSDDHLLLVSKYFTANNDSAEVKGIALKEETNAPLAEDYISLPLNEQSMIPSPSMQLREDGRAVSSSRTSYDNLPHQCVDFDDDFDLSRNVSQVPSRAQLEFTSENEIEKKFSSGAVLQTPRKEEPLVVSPPDTATGKLFATGSLVDDVRSGQFDSLLSWTRQLDTIDIDKY
jgi:hypothetical protein